MKFLLYNCVFFWFLTGLWLIQKLDWIWEAEDWKKTAYEYTHTPTGEDFSEGWKCDSMP